MDQLIIDNALHWLAVLIYGFATIFNTIGIFFFKEKFVEYGQRLALSGLFVHGVALLYRWFFLVGHGPYMARSEVISANAWIIIALFFTFYRFFPQIKSTSIIIFPSTFFLIGLSLFLDPPSKVIPVSFHGIWLILHVIFIKLSSAGFLISLSFSIFVILKKRRSYKWLNRLPETTLLDMSAYRFAGFGFVFWTNAVLSGSLWAYKSWGRFWGWDVVESWSLITWLLFGIYLHLRKFFNLKGEPAAYLLIFCFIISICTLFFIPLLDTSIHAGYFK